MATVSDYSFVWMMGFFWLPKKNKKAVKLSQTISYQVAVFQD